MKKIRWLWILIIGMLFILQSATNGAEPIRRVPEIPESFQRYVDHLLPSNLGDLFAVLDNGLTVLIREQTGVNLVSAQVFVRAGSIFEGDHLSSGISHYLEHVVAAGTTRSFSEEQAKEIRQRLGGESNAYTSFDRTVYFMNTASDHWKEAVDLLLASVSECMLEPREVQRESGVIQQELKMGENEPRRELWRLFLNTAYTVHPVRHPVPGYEQVFLKLGREDLLRYYHSMYRPQNMVVVVTGNVKASEVLQFISERTREFVRTAEVVQTGPDEPLQQTPRWAERRLSAARLTQAMLGFPTVMLNHEDLYALDVLALLLGEGETSRLHSRLKIREQQVLSVSASHWTPSFVHGELIVSLDLPSENWPGVMTNLRQELDRFKDEGVSSGEIEKAKQKVIAQHVFDQQAISAMAATMASSFLDTGDPYFDAAYVGGIGRVTAADVQRVAQRYLDWERLTVAVVRPAASSGAGKAQDATSGEQRLRAASRHELENGLRVLLKQDPSLPLVTIQLHGLGGVLLEAAGQPGISNFTASLVTAGTGVRTRQEIIEAIEGVGGIIRCGSHNNAYSISIKVLKDDLDQVLDMLADVVQNARFPEEEIERKRDEILLAIRKNDESWQMEINGLFRRNYFTNHPYAHDHLGTPDAVRSYTRQDLLDFYHRMMNPERAVLAVYGDIESGTLLEKIREKFEDWQPRLQTTLEWPDETRPLTVDRTVEKPSEKGSAALFIGMNGLDLRDPQRPVMDVLKGLLSGIGQPSGRLFDALRGGDRDLVYVVHAYPFYGINAGYFGVITQTTSGNLDRVQQIILDKLKGVASEPISAEDLEGAKKMVLGMHRQTLETLDAQAWSAASNELLGLGWDYDRCYPDLIRSVRVEDIQTLASRLFEHLLLVRTIPERPTEILVGPPSG